MADLDGHQPGDQPVTKADILKLASHLAWRRLQDLELLNSLDLERRYLRARMAGVAEPSPVDRRITDRLREPLDLGGVWLRDYMVVGEVVGSCAERGWI